MKGRTRRIIEGAGIGAATWGIYGLVASLLHVTLFTLRDRERFLADPYWRVLLTSLGGLALAGLILGAVLGTITVRRDRLRLALLLTVAMSMFLYEASGYWRSRRALAVAPVLALLAWQVIRPSRWTILGMIRSPWLVSVLLLVPPALPRIIFFWGADSALVGILILATVAVAWMGARRQEAIVGEGILAVAALALIAGLPYALRTPSLATAANPAPGPGRPNIILIVWDTVRADRLSAYGATRDTTPHLRDFAREATLFRRAIATTSWTLGSHASMMTGLFSDNHGAHASPNSRFGGALSKNAFTLAEALSAEGYRTAAIIANHGYLNRWFGIGQGFDLYDARAPLFAMPDRGLHRSRPMKSLIALAGGRWKDEFSYRPSPLIRREAEALVDRMRGDGRPFFLFLNFMDAHAPLLPPPPYDTRYPGGLPGVTEDKAKEWRTRSVRDDWNPPAGFREHESSRYDGAIAYLDQETARFLQRIKEVDLFENSLIFITSDHGETLGERNFWMHPVSVSQGQVHIPLVVKFPSSRQAAVSDEVVSLADLMPTALSAAAVRVTRKFDGRDLAVPPGPEGRRVFADHIPPEPMSRWYGKRAARNQHAVFVDGMKYIIMSDGSKELYDPWGDPNEEKNLYRPGDDAIRKLDLLMQSRIKLFKAPGKPSLGLSPADLDRLRSLGYVQ